MATMHGSVDPLGRPLLRVTVQGRDDELLTTVDTGFNGELLMSEAAAAQWGIRPFGVEREITLGDGSAIEAKHGLVTVMWLGKPREATVWLTPSPRATRVSTGGDGPTALAGTRLLAPHILMINFGSGTLRVR